MRVGYKKCDFWQNLYRNVHCTWLQKSTAYQEVNLDTTFCVCPGKKYIRNLIIQTIWRHIISPDNHGFI